MAVCGLPDPRADHAVIMARFALDCMSRMQALTKKLEIMLGPDTGDLSMRIGIHSGPVTTGVLRGERSRFQLFGDTMNTASRMESTGEVNRVQVSEETSKLLIKAGKDHWLVPRENSVQAKGKGILTTFWLRRPGTASIEQFVDEGRNVSFPSRGGGNSSTLTNRTSSSKTARLISWNVEVLLNLIKQIVRLRKSRNITDSFDRLKYETEVTTKALNGSITMLDEVEEVIWLPRNDPVTPQPKLDE